MLFSLAPKDNVKNLYNREKELDELEKSIETGKIIVIDGKMRMGKTSLLKTFLNNQNNPFILVDCRTIKRNSKKSLKEFDSLIIKKIENTLNKEKFINFVKNIESVKVGSFEIDLNSKKSESFVSFISKVNQELKKKNKKLIIAFDESQNLRFYGKKGEDFLNFLAYCYDNFDNIVFILTGRQNKIGDTLLEIKNPDSPMFGRYVNEVRVKRFSKSQSLNFLKYGFEEIGIEADNSEIQKAVDTFGGVVGYLSIYGFTVYDGKDWQKALEKTKELAFNIINEEIRQLKKSSTNYIKVLKAISYGLDSFSTIKEYIDLHYSKISNQTLTNCLKTLIKKNFIDFEYSKNKKKYFISDSILIRFLKTKF